MTSVAVWMEMCRGRKRENKNIRKIALKLIAKDKAYKGWNGTGKNAGKPWRYSKIIQGQKLSRSTKIGPSETEEQIRYSMCNAALDYIWHIICRLEVKSYFLTLLWSFWTTQSPTQVNGWRIHGKRDRFEKTGRKFLIRKKKFLKLTKMRSNMSWFGVDISARRGML